MLTVAVAVAACMPTYPTGNVAASIPKITKKGG